MFEEKITTHEVKSLDELNQFIEQKKSEGYSDIIPYNNIREFEIGFLVGQPWPTKIDVEKITSKEIFYVNSIHVFYKIYPTAKVNECKLIEDVDEIKKLLDLHWGKLRKSDNPKKLRCGFTWYDYEKDEINSFEFKLSYIRRHPELKDILVGHGLWTFCS